VETRDQVGSTVRNTRALTDRMSPRGTTSPSSAARRFFERLVAVLSAVSVCWVLGEEMTGTSSQFPFDPIRVDRSGAAIYLDVCVRSIDYLRSTKRLRALRDGRKVYFLLSDLQSYAKVNHTTPIRPQKKGGSNE